MVGLAPSLALCASAICVPASATDLEIGSLAFHSKTGLSYGMAVRTEAPDPRLIGKLNLDPNICGSSDCISFSGDPAQNAKLVKAPGAYFGSNKDNGDLNYGRWNLVAAVSRISEDLVIHWSDLTFKLGAQILFDPVNYYKDEHHPDSTFQPPLTPRSTGAQRELGKDWQLKDALVSGKFSLLDHDFSVSAGYQHIRWGEANFVALNSLGQINPPSQTLLHQPGTAIGDIFRPVPALLFSTQMNDQVSLDLLYELAWVPGVADPDGSFYSAYDVIKGNYVMLSSGQFHEDPNGLARLPPPANSISNSSATARMLDDHFGYPRGSGQFGGRLSYFAPGFNGGTEFGFYALNYHSQLPYFSAVAANESCAYNSKSFVEAFFDCNGFIGLNPATGKEPLPVDTFKGFLEYPPDIQMYGMSFNTNIGKWSLAGEYSIRPNLPVQVAVLDIAYAGLQPAFPKQDLSLGANAATLAQTASSLGSVIGGITTNNPSQLLQDGTTFLNSLPTILQVIGSGGVTIPSGRTFVPDYLEGYRGFTVQPNQIIHGYQRLVVDQLDLTGIRAFGRSENPFGADQVLLLTEFGMTHIWNMPARSRLQLEGGDNNDTHASPGADGSGWPAGTSPDTYSRTMNPTQQTHGFASSFACGYRILAQFEYDNLLWDLNFKPSLTWGQDLSGIAPRPMQNFVAGTKLYVVGTTIESGAHWNGQIFYQGSTGGGGVNTQRDRDVLALALTYAF